MRRTRIKVLELNDGTKRYFPQYRGKFDAKEFFGEPEYIFAFALFLPIGICLILMDIFYWNSTHDILHDCSQTEMLNKYGITSAFEYKNIDRAKKAVDLAIMKLKERENDKIAKKNECIAKKVKKKTIVKYP